MRALVARSLCSDRCASVSTALATTYVRVEKDGTKTYSDRPIPGGAAHRPATGAGLRAPPAASADRSGRARNSARQTDDFRYQSCARHARRTTRRFTNPETVTIAVVHQPAAASGRYHDR